MKSFLLFFFLLIGSYTFSQGNEWMTLPKTRPISFKKITVPAIIDSVKMNQAQRYVSFNKTKEQPQFIGIVRQKDLGQVSFKESKLELISEVPFTGEFFRKDASKINIKYLDKAHGLPARSLTCTVGDSIGRVYMASDEGLLLYDGSSFRVYGSSTSSNLKTINSMLMDSDGKLWLGTNDGIAYIKNNELFELVPQVSDLIWNIVESTKGEIRFSTQENGAYVIANGNLSQYYSKELESVRYCYMASDLKFWVGLSNSIGYIQNDSLFELNKGDYSHQTTVINEFESDIWFGTFDSGMYKYSDEKLFQVNVGNWSEGRVFSIEKTAKGIWFTCYGIGVGLIKPDQEFVKFWHEDGLTGRLPYSMHIDPFKNIWIVDGRNGVSRIEENVLIPRAYYGEEVLTDIKVFNGAKYFFFTGGVLRKEKAGIKYEILNAETDDIIQDYHVVEGEIISEDDMWLASLGAGLAHLKKEQFTYYRFANKLDLGVGHVKLDNHDRVWFTTDLKKRLHYLKDDTVFCLNDSPKLKTHEFTSLIKGDFGLYAVFDRGLLFIRKDKYIVLNVLSGLLSNNVLNVSKGKNSTVWVFTDKGIQVYRDGEILQTHSTEILSKLTVFSSIQLGPKKWLLATSVGLKEIIVDLEVKVKTYGLDYGASLSDLSVLKEIEGRIYAVSLGDIFQYQSGLLQEKRRAPFFFWKEVQINGVVFKGKVIKIDQKNSLDFVIGSINWGKKSQVFYRLDKDGKKGEWTLTTSNRIHFENLKYGSYSLLVRVDGESISKKVLNKKFTVLPLWYETWQFQIGALLCLVFVGFVYFRFRLKKAQINESKLESIIKSKTREIEEEKKQVEKQLGEKSLLLKEVNHRVKNNMQLVSSVLELQQLKTKEKDAKNSLVIASERIKSLAMAHQTLYQNVDYESINLRDYIQLIFNGLLRFGSVESTIEISESMMIHIEKGQALGFVINELVTNSLKYAWNEDEADKKITLSIKHEANGEYVLIYQDNGKGYPKEFKIGDQRSLGSSLIKSFVERQLKGELKLYNANGAVSQIKFELDEV